MATEVKVSVLPICDVCRKVEAAYDGRTQTGPWAYMCETCWRKVGVQRLGTGFGQRLVLSEVPGC